MRQTDFAGGAAVAQDRYVIKALDDGLAVLLLFLGQETLTVTRVAQSLDVTRSKAHRILSTLRAREMVEMGAGGRSYLPGPAFAELARPLSLDPETRRATHRVLVEASETTGETMNAGVQVGSQVLIFDSVPARRPDSVESRAGQLRPAYCTSAGKLLLAQLSSGQVTLLFPDEELARLTPSTLPTRSALLAALRTIADQDYALQQEESEPRICGAAVLLQGRTWRDRISIHASVPVHRGSRQQLMTIVGTLRHIVADHRHRRSALGFDA